MKIKCKIEYIRMVNYKFRLNNAISCDIVMDNMKTPCSILFYFYSLT